MLNSFAVFLMTILLSSKMRWTLEILTVHSQSFGTRIFIQGQVMSWKLFLYGPKKAGTRGVLISRVLFLQEKKIALANHKTDFAKPVRTKCTQLKSDYISPMISSLFMRQNLEFVQQFRFHEFLVISIIVWVAFRLEYWKRQILYSKYLVLFHTF